jgi:predicted oxidoreductase
MSWNPLGFEKGYSANHRLQQILATLVSKYHVGADTILLLGFKHPAKVIPIAGTVNCQNTIVN